MTKEEFDRINYLSEKVVYKLANESEIREFHQLLKIWNSTMNQSAILRYRETQE